MMDQNAPAHTGCSRHSTRPQAELSQSPQAPQDTAGRCGGSQTASSSAGGDACWRFSDGLITSAKHLGMLQDEKRYVRAR